MNKIINKKNLAILALGAAIGASACVGIPKVADIFSRKDSPVQIANPRNQYASSVKIIEGAPDQLFYSEDGWKKTAESLNAAYKTFSQTADNAELFHVNSKKEDIMSDIMKSARDTDRLFIVLWNVLPRKTEVERGISEKRAERNFFEVADGDIFAPDITNALNYGDYKEAVIIGNFENLGFRSKMNSVSYGFSGIEAIGPRNTLVLGVNSTDKYGNSSLLNIAKRYARNPSQSIKELVGPELNEGISAYFNEAGLERSIHLSPDYSMPLFKNTSCQ